MVLRREAEDVEERNTCLNPTFPGDGSEMPTGTYRVKNTGVLILLSLEMVLRHSSGSIGLELVPSLNPTFPGDGSEGHIPGD